MGYFAAALARTGSTWRGQEFDLDDEADLDSVVDQLRDLVDGTEPAMLLVEEDDEWFGVIRLDANGDSRLFLSDARVIAVSALAAALFQDASVLSPPEPSEEDKESLRLEGEPAGDPELLADLGTPGSRLLELCAEEGMLPSDVTSAICEKAGCLDCLEELRGT